MEDTIDPSPTGKGSSQTIEKPPNYDIPFLQSSQTVRRSTVTVNHLNGTTEPNTQGCSRHTPALDLDKLLADQEYKHKQHLTADQKSQVDKHLGLVKSQTASRYIDDQLLEADQQSPWKLPKPSELLSRSRKRNNKQRSAVSKNAIAVEEHVTQLQRKKTNFYGTSIQRHEEPFSPQDVRVQVTREQLQQVPTSSDTVQHSSCSSTFWSTNDWLFGQSCTNNLREVPKAYIPQGSPTNIAEYTISDDQRLGTPLSEFEEHEMTNEGYQGNENMDLWHFKSNSKHGQYHPEE